MVSTDFSLTDLVKNASLKTLTVTWLFTVVVLSVATLGAFGVIPSLIGDFILGLLMIFAGSILVVETYYESGFSTKDFSDMFGMAVAILAGLYGLGSMTGIELVTSNLESVKLIILPVLVLNIVYEGVANRS